MTFRLSRRALSLVIAGSLTSFASASYAATAQPAERLAQVRAGQTQQQVRSIAGRPGNITANPRDGGQLWIYEYRDGWGELSRMDVAFGPDGKVIDTYSERTR